MRWLTKLVFAVVALSGAAFGQAFTNVSAQVKDAQGNLYTNCVFNIQFVGQSSLPGPYLLQGSVFQQSYGGVRCDGFGNFSIRLPSNQAIFPQPSAWQFNVCDSSGRYCNASGSVVLLIASGAQDISSFLTPALPILPPPGAAVNSVFGRLGNVVATTGDYTWDQIVGAAPIANPVFLGNPQVPTATPGTTNNQAASTSFVMNALNNVGWHPPTAPGDTLFGNNGVGTSAPSFFTPGGDVSFSAGNFSVNRLHFGPNALALTNTGIATGNCLTISGSNLIGGPCGTGGGASLPGLSSDGTTLTFTGTAGVSASQFNVTGTGGYLLTSPVSPVPANTAGAGQNGLTSGPDGWYLSEANGPWTRIGTGGAAAGVTSFGTPPRQGAVVPATGDYTVAQVTGAASLASPALTGTPTSITGPNGDTSTQIATNQFVGNALTNAGAGGGHYVPITQISHSTTAAPYCLGQTSATLSFLAIPVQGTISAGDTVVVMVAHRNSGFTLTSVGDNVGSTYTQQQSYPGGGNSGSRNIWTTAPGAANAGGTQINVQASAAGVFVACVVAYQGVASFSAVTPTATGATASSSGSIPASLGPENNNVMLATMSVQGNWGATLTITPPAVHLTGTLVATSGNATQTALCEATLATPGTATCTSAVTGTFYWYNAAIQLHCCAGNVGTPPLPGFLRVVAYQTSNVASTDLATATRTRLCSIANCPLGVYRLNFAMVALTATSASCVGGNVNVSLYYSDEDQNPKTVTSLLTTAMPFTTNTSAFTSYIFQNQALTTIDVSTTGTACTTGGPGRGHIYYSLERLQ